MRSEVLFIFGVQWHNKLLQSHWKQQQQQQQNECFSALFYK